MTRTGRLQQWLLLAALILLCGATALAAPVAVRYQEGIVRGFLSLKTTGGAVIASGDFLQVKKGAEVETRIRLHFKDGSLYDETAHFTQEKSFSLQDYRLVHKGPAFRQDMTATLERSSGKYRVVVKPHDGGGEKVYDGKLDLPEDTYNGMVPIVAKNLKGAGASVHLVAFTPAPRVIGLDLIPSGENKVSVGALEKAVLHYVLKPKLGLGLKIPAALLGRLPPDNDLWIMTEEVPAFIRFQGPLYPDGPVWQIELAAPRWVK